MKVVLLCGGYGTRIRDVTSDVPKPMIPLGGTPILWHIMKYYAHFGYDRFVLCLGYKSTTIKDFFLNYEARTNDFTIRPGTNEFVEYHNRHAESNWEVTLVDTGLETLTGGRVRRIHEFIGDDEHFMLTYGDGLSTIDISALVDFHKSHGRILTVSGVRPPGRFGEMVFSEEGQVREFNEKPQATAGRISGGYFVCRRELFDYLPDRDDLVFEEGPMKQLVQDGQLMAFQHDGFWQPMDTHRDYRYLSGLLERGEAPWCVWKD